MGSLGPKLVGFVADAGDRSVEAYRNAYWSLAGLVFVGFVLALFLKPLARALKVDRFGQTTPAAAPVVEVVSAK
jgi:hypothetical protein